MGPQREIHCKMKHSRVYVSFELQQHLDAMRLDAENFESFELSSFSGTDKSVELEVKRLLRRIVSEVQIHRLGVS